MRWHSLQRYDRSSISEQHAGHFIARSLLILEMLSLQNDCRQIAHVRNDAEFPQSSHQWIGSHIGLKANTVAYHLRRTAMRTCSAALGANKSIDSVNGNRKRSPKIDQLQINYDEVLVLV